MDERKINPIPPLRGEQEDRFWDHVKVVAGSCWLWTGAVSKTGGYGIVHVNGKVYKAHRMAYALLAGDTERELDHLCRNRQCVNPDHVEPVTSRDNWRRGFNPAAIQARKTHCKRGHEFTPENTILKSNGRERKCRTCYVADYQERSRQRSNRRKGSIAA
jgi:Pyruvate/2-oxoacid:ferredoxin oxidoreductase delta subunit